MFSKSTVLATAVLAGLLAVVPAADAVAAPAPCAMFCEDKPPSAEKCTMFCTEPAPSAGAQGCRLFCELSTSRNPEVL